MSRFINCKHMTWGYVMKLNKKRLKVGNSQCTSSNQLPKHDLISIFTNYLLCLLPSLKSWLRVTQCWFAIANRLTSMKETLNSDQFAWGKRFHFQLTWTFFIIIVDIFTIGLRFYVDALVYVNGVECFKCYLYSFICKCVFHWLIDC